MIILLEHSTPAPLRYALKGHVVVEAVERGWERLVNGALLDAATPGSYTEVDVPFHSIIVPES